MAGHYLDGVLYLQPPLSGFVPFLAMRVAEKWYW
jgi:hypothetical protein